MKSALIALISFMPILTWAGGSNYGITPGTISNPTGKVNEWPVPTPRFARDPTIAPDGNVFVTLMSDNKMARFDPKAQTFKEWDIVDKQGMVWTTGNGNGTIGKLDPAAMKVVKEYALPHGDSGPYAVNTDGAGIVWVNEIDTDTVVRFDPKSEQMRVMKLPSSGVGLRKMAVDTQGKLWHMGSHNGRLGVI